MQPRERERNGKYEKKKGKYSQNTKEDNLLYTYQEFQKKTESGQAAMFADIMAEKACH